MVKTPKRYPVPNQIWAFTDNLDLGPVAPAWTLASAMLMTGLTHPDVGQLRVLLDHYRNGLVERQLTLRAFANGGEANNFTSYDLLNLGVARSELAAGGVWYLQAWDSTADAMKGQMEYAQIQLTVHTLPNRADTDADGLIDSEEVNLGSDGFMTNPRTSDSDGDGVADRLEAFGWSRQDGSPFANADGFFTDPTRADTDYDGYGDGVDRWPLQDVYVEIKVADYWLITRNEWSWVDPNTGRIVAYP